MRRKQQRQRGRRIASNENLEDVVLRERSTDFNLFFNLFAKKVADIVGNALVFALSLLLVIVWAVTGPLFNYSDTWQLVINTATTVITFLVVFLIQNTQNRDTEIINLKLDELIKSKKGARNSLINLDNLSDADLKRVEKQFRKLHNKRTGN